MSKTQDIFKKRKYRSSAIFFAAAVLYWFTAAGVGFQAGISLSAVPESFIWLFTNFIPTEDSLAFLPMIFSRLLQTVLLSVTATMSGAAVALIAAILGSNVAGHTFFLKTAIRGFASFFRNIPIVVWAMILLLSFKQSEFTGYLAISFTTFGYLTRSFTEVIDEVAGSVVEAMSALGASYIQIVFQGILPMCFNQLVSWLLFLIENNIRDATLVGILTGTGIGFLFDFYYKNFQYDIAGMVTLLIVIVVISLEVFSNKIRRVIC
ncbi:putative phosphonate ABC transporter, permease protein PhnE [Enterococcus faecalis 13-SD-W-01]|nr:putative phosphonate ABC transporter, permease protein PhnE [Enterococcus faecalis 13-SD-W-01]